METKKLKCGHKLNWYELSKSEGIVFIRYNCVKECQTEWFSMGEVPDANEIEIYSDSDNLNLKLHELILIN